MLVAPTHRLTQVVTVGKYGCDQTTATWTNAKEIMEAVFLIK